MSVTVMFLFIYRTCLWIACLGVLKLTAAEFEKWKQDNADSADVLDAMIFALQQIKGVCNKKAEMRDDLSALIARVRGLEM